MPNGVTPDDIALQGFRYARARLGDGLAEVGRATSLLLEIVQVSARRPPAARLVLQQMRTIGVESLGLVVIVSLFTGAVSAVQAAYQFTAVVPLKYLSGVILRGVVIELGPVLTALVIGGRVGAAIAAELGTMKVTEQIDALRAMGISPVRYLVAPRVFAALAMLPVLTVYADAIAVFGGYVVAVSSLDVPSPVYLSGLQEFFRLKDLLSGLFKAVFFGGIIGLMGCYFGFQTEGGAEGVGRATTRAVVAACVLILILDYVLATVLFRVILV
jgi:phospholipid/cholesterol/gamma-HCH transport system permease protein